MKILVQLFKNIEIHYHSVLRFSEFCNSGFNVTNVIDYWEKLGICKENPPISVIS